jgi:hypothetical protein
MTEKQAFENNEVLLWGEKKASSILLNKFDFGNKNPRSLARKKTEDKPKKKKVRVFSEDEKYTKKDLPFLNKELERIISEQNTAEEESFDDLLDLQDKIEDMIESVKNMDDDVVGNGIYEEMYGTGYKKGSPEALAWAQRMREAREAKKALTVKPVPQKEVKKAGVVKSTSTKSRFEKGSEAAKEASKRMVEARKKKAGEKKVAKEKNDEMINLITKIKGKPWYYIGDIPKGYREATEDEAIEAKKVSEYGKYKVDNERWSMYKDFDILLSYNKKPLEVKWIMRGIERRIMKILKDISILEGRIDNEKIGKVEGNNKLEDLKYLKKKLASGYNWYMKLIAQLLKKDYVRKVFKLDSSKEDIKFTPSEIKVVKPKEVVDIRTGEIVKKKSTKKPKVKFIAFMKGNTRIDVKETWFDDSGKLLSKKADYLYTKGILLDKDYYKQSDYNKFIYIKI